MVDDYRFGKIVLDGQSYDHDIIVHRGEVHNWWREKGHSVCEADLREVFEGGPSRLVLGTGAFGMVRVPKHVRDAVGQRGIELVVGKSGKAVRDFNRSLDRGEDVALAVHLTC